MTPEELRRLSSAVDRIKRLDETMDRMAAKAEACLEEMGEKVIGVIGRNVIDKRKDWVGEVTWVAVFNAIRSEREALRAELNGRVDISETVHKVQKVQNNA